MLNVSKAVYDVLLPVPLVKQVSITDWPTQQSEDLRDSPDKVYKFAVDVMLQTTRDRYDDPVNLTVAAITDKLDMQLASNDAIRRNYVRVQSDLVKNVKVTDLLKNTGKYLYSRNQSETLSSKIVSVEFEINTPEMLQDLTLLVFTSPVSKDYYTKSPANPRVNSSLAMSRYALEDVLINGSLVGKSEVYTLAEDLPSYGMQGDVWSGPTHVHDGVRMAEAAHSVVAHPKLNTSVVMNQKIKDYRIEKINVFPQHGAEIPGRDRYLSELYFSRGSDNSLSMFFSFDLLSFMKKNGAVSHLLNNDVALLSMSKIENIKLYRQRANMNDMGNRLTPDRVNDKACQRLEKKLIASLSRETITAVQASNEPTPGVREFVAYDSEISLESKNYYNYELEFEIVDEGPTVLSRLSNKLQDLLAEFNSSYKLKFLNKGKKNYDTLGYLVANIDSLSANKTWEALLYQYLLTLSFMGLPAQKDFSLLSMATNLYNFASPYSADTTSLLKFEEIINKFVEQLNMRMLPSTVSQSEDKFSVRSKIDGSSASSRRIKYVPSIRQSYYNDLSSDTGLDYFGNYILNQANNLARVSFEAYSSRTSEEATKYDISNAASEGINPYGFLSPSVVRAGSTDIRATLGIKDDSFLDLIRSNSTPVRNYLGSPAIQSNKTAQIQELLGTAGVTVSPRAVELASIVSRTPGSPKSVKDASFYLDKIGSGSANFVINNRAAEEASSGSLGTKLKARTTRSSRVANNTFSSNMISKGVASFVKQAPSDMEVIQGSYSYANYKKSNNGFFSRHATDQNINFNSVVRVEYLNSYAPRPTMTSRGISTQDEHWLSTQDEHWISGAPILEWTQLTSDVYAQAATNSTPLLCRLRGPLKSLSSENPFDLQKYNTLFILGDTNLLPADADAAQITTSESYLSQIRTQISKLFKQGALNNRTPNGPALSQYTMTSTMSQPLIPTPSRSVPSRAPQRTAPRRATAPAPRTRSGGGGGRGGY